MRNRKSILILALILAFGMSLWYYGWNFFQANEKIRSYFIEKFRPILSESFNIEQLQVSLGAVHLKGVQYEHRQFLLKIDDVRIGYSIIGLIIHGFNPESIANDISLIYPRFYLKSFQAPNPQNADSTSPYNYQEIELRSQAFEFIERITISHGSVYLQDSLTNQILLGSEINGFINSTDLDLAVAHAEGKLFSSSNKNVNLIARLNLLTGQLYQLDLQLDNFELIETPRFLLPELLSFHAGFLTGDLRLAKAGEKNWRGKIKITDAALRLKNPDREVKHIFLEAEINNRDLIIKHSTQEFEKSSFKVGGVIRDLLAPQLDLIVESEQINLKSALLLFFPQIDFQVHGPGRISLAIQGTLNDPKIQGELASKEFQIAQFEKNNVHFKFLFQNQILKFELISGNIFQSPITASGKIDFRVTPALINLKIIANGSITPYLEQIKASGLKHGDFDLHLNVGGNLQQPQMNGEINAVLVTLRNQQIHLYNTIEFQSNNFTIHSKSSKWAA